MSTIWKRTNGTQFLRRHAENAGMLLKELRRTLLRRLGAGEGLSVHPADPIAPLVQPHAGILRFESLRGQRALTEHAGAGSAEINRIGHMANFAPLASAVAVDGISPVADLAER